MKANKIEILKAINRAADNNDTEAKDIMMEAFYDVINKEDEQKKYIRQYSLSSEVEEEFCKYMLQG